MFDDDCLIAFLIGWFLGGVDSSDRVFYFHDDIGYARKVDDFLGLVEPEHPGQEGLLRFTEVKSER